MSTDYSTISNTSIYFEPVVFIVMNGEKVKKKVLRIIVSVVFCIGLMSVVPVHGATDSSEELASTTGKRVYLAGPLFNQAEKEFNLRITKVLEEHGYEVFLPQRDGYLAAELQGLSEEELTKKIFEKDCEELLKSDIVFVNLDGQVPDEGACVELGIGYANGKRCYGFKTDTRFATGNLEINPMIAGCFIKCFINYDGDDLIREIEQYLAEHEL